MTGYIDLFTPETWKAFREHGSAVSGFRNSQRNSASRIKPGDILVCYLVGLGRWVGTLKVASPLYEDSTPLFVEGEDPFVMRFKVQAITQLDPELGVPIKHLWNRLAICKGVDPDKRGWSYKVRVVRSLSAIPAEERQRDRRRAQETGK